MSNKLFKSFFAFAMVLGAALGFVACTDQEEPAKVNPEISLSEQAVNFTSAEGSKTVSVTSNSQWEVKVDESADWVSVTPSSGNNNGTITVHVAANDSGAFRSTDVKVSVLNAEYNNAVWDTKKFTVSQSADENPIVDEVLLYGDNFDGVEATKTYGNSGNSWPYVDQFPQFANAQGPASENVTYEGTGVSIRVVSDGGSAGSHSDYNGSGSNNVFFGAGACFYVKNISPLQDGHKHYKITFGTEKYEQDGDSTFRNEEFILSISKNGEEWAPIEYTYPYSNSAEGRWNVATANFTLANVPEALYIKFEAKVGSVYRIDDLKLFVGNGGQAVDLDNIEVVVPEPPTTDALFFDNFDGKTAVKDGSGYWPYIADFPEMKNAAGPAAVNVAYEGYNTTVRNNSNSNGSYSDYDGSGLNNIFFGKDNAWFAIKDLTLEPTQKNLILTFGGDKYMQSGNSTFSTSEFLVSISGDGQKWSNVEYTFAGTADGRWNVATANFTLAEVPAKLYIKFTATAESAYRLDDVTLDLGEGGQLIDLANGTTEEPSTPDQPVDPDQPNTPATGVYQSDSAFVCSADDSASAVYTLGSSTVNGASASGFKLGTGKLSGYFKSGVVSVEGAKYLNFYAVAWKGKSATLYYRVDGGEAHSLTLNSNDGATGNPPYTITGVDADHYSVLLEGLTATSTIEFSTDASFAAVDNATTGRAVVFGVKLSDEPIGAETPSEPTPDPTPSEPTTVATIADVLALSQGATISGTIEAVVVSNYVLNNLTSKKGMYVQDATGALQLRLSADHTYAFGTKLQIDLTGTTLGQYGGAVQVEVNAGNITEVSTGNTVTPKTVAMADFLANKYEGQYVALEGVQVADADLAKTWVSGSAHTNINMEDAQGNKFVVFSSKYATYGAETVAQGAGTIKGIASINNGNIQIIFAQASDYAGLTGERFDGVVTPDPTPDPTPGDGASNVVKFAFADVKAQNANLTENAYGSQNVETESTWISWTAGDITFKGARVCVANGDNAGYMQMQGNASEVLKQGFIVNADAIPGKITKIVVKTFNVKYTPNFNLYLGTSTNPSENEMQSGSYSDAGVAVGSGKLYTTTFNVSGEYNFFKMHNNTTGACYFDSIEVYYE